MERAEIIAVIKVLNKETDLLKKIKEDKILIAGKGSKLADLQKNFKRIMLKLDDKKLIDDTPEDAIDFWEANLAIFGTKKQKDAKKKADAKADADAKAKTAAADDDKFAKLVEKITGRDDSKLTYILDKMFVDGLGLEDMLKKLRAVSKKRGLTTSISKGYINSVLKSREGSGWIFDDKRKLVGFGKNV